jgi:hypothetical protein
MNHCLHSHCDWSSVVHVLLHTILFSLYQSCLLFILHYIVLNSEFRKKIRETIYDSQADIHVFHVHTGINTRNKIIWNKIFTHTHIYIYIYKSTLLNVAILVSVIKWAQTKQIRNFSCILAHLQQPPFIIVNLEILLHWINAVLYPTTASFM